MKIIELLNLVYEKKAPKRILYKYCEYEFDIESNDYINKNNICLFQYMFNYEGKALWKEVEVIDETKDKSKIDKLSYQQIGSWRLEQHDYIEYSRAVDKQIKQLGSKVNEIIEKLNYILEKSDKK